MFAPQNTLEIEALAVAIDVQIADHETAVVHGLRAVIAEDGHFGPDTMAKVADLMHEDIDQVTTALAAVHARYTV